MSDQTDLRLDSIDERIDRIVTALESLLNVQDNTRRRVQQHDHELDDHDERVEALERNLSELKQIAARQEETSNDIRAILQLVTRRFSGEPPQTDLQ
ncbi:MAG: hypothetical protein VKJ24_09880 [Synechococcales bacterium]|nr:hypothetical protein [Synechococcales bacterium]